MIKLSKRLILIITTAVIVAAGAITGITIAATRDKGYSYSLSQKARNLTFHSLETKYSFPQVITNDPSFTFEWFYKSSEIESYPVAFKVRDEDRFTLNFIEGDLGIDRTSTTFFVRIFGSGSTNPVELDFVVNVTDRGEDYFATLSSSQHGHTSYQTHGIGKSRVFGLYDIPETAYNITPASFQSIDLDNLFIKSEDSFNLQWRYKGAVEIEYEIEVIEDTNGTGVIEVIYDPEQSQKTVTVNFLGEGSARVIFESTTEFAMGARAWYSYTYNIKNAVNTQNFADIKLMERLARYDYISNGVKQQESNDFVIRQNNTVLDNSANLTDYIVANSNPNGLLSRHFKTTATRYTNAGHRNVPSIQTNYDGDIWGNFFNEFDRWAPAYRFKDIVIRSSSKDNELARRDYMYTWVESTWFFGSVYGNGYQLDATTYTRGVSGYDDEVYKHEGRYRNIHSMRGDNAHSINNSTPGLLPYSLGFDGKLFFQGYGWGEIFAFYALSNNSTIDNLTMTGENIPEGASSIRLNQYRKIGILGVSTLSGGRYRPDPNSNTIINMPFGQAHIHNNGRFDKPGLYNEGIKVQNSILEKGLTLFGANYAPDASNPIIADTCVFRYAGFSAIVGNSYGGGVGGQDFEGGRAVAGRNPDGTINSSFGNLLSYRDGEGFFRGEGYDGSGNFFGNFIEARNNIYHDISVTPLLTMPSLSGTHIEVTGDDNGFFTWIKSNDIQFPTMKNEINEGEYLVLNMGINQVVVPIMNKLFASSWINRLLRLQTPPITENNLLSRNILPNGTFVINIPYISVIDSGQTPARNPDDPKYNRNMLKFSNSSLNGATRNDLGLVMDAGGVMALGGQQNQGFYFTMMLTPDNAPASANMTRFEDQNPDFIRAKMSAMIPAGSQLPARVARVREDINAETIILGKAGTTQLEGHRLEYNGEAIGTYRIGWDDFEITKTQRQTAGMDKFGYYQLNLVNQEGEIISSSVLLLEGSDESNPNISAGSIGYDPTSPDDGFIKYPINIDEGNIIQGLRLKGNGWFIRGWSYHNGEIVLPSNQLDDGTQVIEVITRNWIIEITQSVVKKSVGANVNTVNITAGEDLIIELFEGTGITGLEIEIAGNPNIEYTRIDNTITVTRLTLESLPNVDYVVGWYPMVIHNTNGLELHRQVVFINNSTQNINIEQISTPYFNIADNHRDNENDIVLTLSNYNGQNITKVSFNEFELTDGFIMDPVTQELTISSLAIARLGLIAGYEYGITVFSCMSNIGVNNPNITLRIFDNNHEQSVRFIFEGGIYNLDSNEDFIIGLSNHVRLSRTGPLGMNWFSTGTFTTFSSDDNVVLIYKGNELIDSGTRSDTEYLVRADGEPAGSILMGTYTNIVAVNISAEILKSWGAGEYTIVLMNDFNITYFILTIEGENHG